MPPKEIYKDLGIGLAGYTLVYWTHMHFGTGVPLCICNIIPYSCTWTSIPDMAI